MVENVIISSYSAISDVFLRCYMAVHEPSQLNIPAFWLEPVFHSVYLQAMVNFDEKYGEVDQSNVQTIEIRPGMHSLMRTHNLLRQLGFSPSPQSGFDFGFSVPPAAHGAMGQAAITSEDIGQTFMAIAEYTPMRNNLFQYTWKENQDAGTLLIRPRFDIGAYGGFLLGGTAGTFMQMASFLLGPREFANLVVRLPWRLQPHRPGSSHLLASVETQLLKGANHGEISIPAGLLRHRNATRDSRQYRLACEACRIELQALSGSTAARVKIQLQGMECSTWPTLAGMAEILTMSRRTLSRKLDRESTSYQALIDEIRANLACWTLENTSQSVSNLAYDLGFKDERNFSRSFRRWTNTTPTQYRKLQR